MSICNITLQSVHLQRMSKEEFKGSIVNSQAFDVVSSVRIFIDSAIMAHFLSSVHEGSGTVLDLLVDLECVEIRQSE